MCKCEKKKGTGMRKIKEVLRLSQEGNLSFRQIGNSCNLSTSTVSKIISNAATHQISWPLPENINPEECRAKLLGIELSPAYELSRSSGNSSLKVSMEEISKELSRKGVTLKLLWEENTQAGLINYSYSHFCALFDDWRKKNKEVSMRFKHKAGEKLFVDWAGQTISYHNHETGNEDKAYLFVAVLGASNYTYASVFPNMKLPNWIAAHEETLNYFGGVPEIIVPDNTKTAVSNSCYYDPDLNPTYRDFADHYDTVILPARPRKPQDKAKVEKGVQIAENRILAAIRDIHFPSFGQLNKVIKEKLEELNHRPFSKMEGNRHSLFNEIEASILKPLPSSKFDFGDWLKAKVHTDYHIQVNYHYYSVPYQYIGHYVDVKIGHDTIQIYMNEQRLAVHKLSLKKGKATTDKAHMPPRHSAYLTRSVDDIKQQAGQIGSNCLLVIDTLLNKMPRPEMAFRSCYGIIRMSKKYSAERTEKACLKAFGIGMCNYRTINNMLENNMENEDSLYNFKPTGNHQNVRGKNYYTRERKSE